MKTELTKIKIFIRESDGETISIVIIIYEVNDGCKRVEILDGETLTLIEQILICNNDDIKRIVDKIESLGNPIKIEEIKLDPIDNDIIGIVKKLLTKN
jgi:hypothetical protein